GLESIARAGRQQLVGRPLAPLHAVHRPQVVGAVAPGTVEPGAVLVGVLIPDPAAQRAEIRGAVGGPEETDQLAHGRLEGQSLGRHGGKALAQVEPQAGPRQAQGAHAGAVVLPGALLEDRADQIQIGLHADCSRTRRARSMRGRSIMRPSRRKVYSPVESAWSTTRRAQSIS